MQPTRGCGGPPHLPLCGLAPGGVCPGLRSPGASCALTARLHPYPAPKHSAWCRAVCFCGTFLGVAPTGSYPAPCPLVSGLSSESLRFSAVARPAPAIILAFPEVHRNRMPGVAQARNAEGHGIGCYLRSKCSCKNATVRSQASCAACALKASGRSFSINQCPVPGYL